MHPFDVKHAQKDMRFQLRNGQRGQNMAIFAAFQDIETLNLLTLLQMSQIKCVRLRQVFTIQGLHKKGHNKPYTGHFSIFGCFILH